MKNFLIMAFVSLFALTAISGCQSEEDKQADSVSDERGGDDAGSSGSQDAGNGDGGDHS